MANKLLSLTFGSIKDLEDPNRNTDKGTDGTLVSNLTGNVQILCISLTDDMSDVNGLSLWR